MRSLKLQTNNARGWFDRIQKIWTTSQMQGKIFLNIWIKF